jgi:hypothetical protein
VSSLLFPTLPGQLFTVAKTPIWTTGFVDSPCGMSGRCAYQPYPGYSWELSWELLRDDFTVALSELKLLQGLFNAMRGSWDNFLYEDPTFNNVTAQAFGIGDGETVNFPLTAIYQASSESPGWPEIIQSPNGAPQISQSGVLVSDSLYALGPTAIVSFATPPPLGAPLTWTGSFYYRCRFMDDQMEASNFLQNWWEVKSLRWESEKL